MGNRVFDGERLEDRMNDGTEYTTQRAEWYKLPLQGEGETNQQFRERIAGTLRGQGKIIEAHEA